MLTCFCCSGCSTSDRRALLSLLQQLLLLLRGRLLLLAGTRRVVAPSSGPTLLCARHLLCCMLVEGDSILWCVFVGSVLRGLAGVGRKEKNCNSRSVANHHEENEA